MIQSSNIDYSVIDLWNSCDSFSDKEKTQMKNIQKIFDSDQIYMNSLVQQMFQQRLAGQNSLQNFDFSFASCATDHIQKLFELHCSDDTVVITSKNEHENVKKCYKEKYVNGQVIELLNEEIMSGDFRRLDNLKATKVLLYFASVQITSGIFVPEEFFMQIKKYLNDSGKYVVSILDDVQSMFLYPRNYSIHDYIIGTAHAIVRKLDLGILLTKKHSIGFDTQVKNVSLKNYFNILDLFLMRKPKIFMFNSMMRTALRRLVASHENWKIIDSVPNYLALKTNIVETDKNLIDRFKNLEIFIECDDSNCVTFRMRAQQFIDGRVQLCDSLRFLEMYLENKK